MFAWHHKRLLSSVIYSIVIVFVPFLSFSVLFFFYQKIRFANNNRSLSYIIAEEFFLLENEIMENKSGSVSVLLRWENFTYSVVMLTFIYTFYCSSSIFRIIITSLRKRNREIIIIVFFFFAKLLNAKRHTLFFSFYF